MTAGGTQATDGRDCSPDRIGPIAARTTFTRATSRPSGVPIDDSQQEAEQAARHAGPDEPSSVPCIHMSRRALSQTAAGGGQLVVVGDLAQTSSCQTSEHQHDRDDRRQDLVDAGLRGAASCVPGRRLQGVEAGLEPPVGRRPSAASARVSQCWPCRRISPRSCSVISTDSSATAVSSIRRGCGMSTVHSRATRPGRDDSSTTRWASRTASRTLCVTKRTETFGLAPDPGQLVVQHVAGDGVERGERLVHQQQLAVLGERPGQRDPLPHAAGQLVHPLAVRARRAGRVRAAARPRRGAPPSARPRSRRASSMFLPAVSHGKSACSWNIRAGRPPGVSMDPAVGRSSPATRLSRVDLPHPDAPRRVTNSPGATSSVMSSRTSCCPAGPAKDFETCVDAGGVLDRSHGPRPW